MVAKLLIESLPVKALVALVGPTVVDSERAAKRS